MMESFKLNICEALLVLNSEKPPLIDNITSGKEPLIKSTGILLAIDEKPESWGGPL